MADRFAFSSPEVRRQIRREECRRSLSAFVQAFWHVIDPEPLAWGWHMEAICDHLQAVTEGAFRKLIICIPPGHAKSMLVSVFWQAWEWIDRPGLRELYGSYEENLTYRDSVRCRDIILSPLYQAMFKPEWQVRKDINSKGYFANTAGGSRKTYYMRSGKKTGWRGNRVVVDDPMSAEDRFDRRVQQQVIDSWDRVLSTRVNDPRTASFVVIMQRLAERDLAGYLIDKYGDAYVQLILPTYFEPDRRCTTPIFADPRTEPGQLLFEEKYPLEAVEEIELRLGPLDFAAQHQHRPFPEGGNRFRSEHFQYWEGLGGLMVRLKHRNGTHEDIRIDYCTFFITMDVATSEKTEADFTSIGLWAITKKGELLLLDRVSMQGKEPAILDAVRAMYSDNRWGRKRPTFIGIEANGPGKPIAQALMASGLPVNEIHISKDKLTLSGAAVIRLAAGMVFFPDYAQAPWMHAFAEQLVGFPGAPHDDDVTMVSLASNSVYEGMSPQIVGSHSVPRAARKDVNRTRADIASRGMYGTKNTPRR